VHFVHTLALQGIATPSRSSSMAQWRNHHSNPGEKQHGAMNTRTARRNDHLNRMAQ
jgi:hypothetical protein